jgi:hypothetical protein
MTIQTADGDPLHQICRSSSSLKISLMHHTQNLTNLDGLPTGTTHLVIIVGLLPAFRARKTNVVEVRVEGVDGMEIKRSEVELRARLRISMWRTSQASHSSTTRRHLLVEAGLLEEGDLLEVTHLISEVIREEDGVVSMLAAEVASAVQGEDGEIGKRSVFYRSLLRIIYAHKDVPLLSEQSDP